MTSHTCILFDLPPQHDAVENMFRDETQHSVLNVVKGRFWGYFMELNAWLPVTATVRVNPRTLDIMAQGAIIKKTIQTEISYYFGAELKIYQCYGQSPDGDPIGDDELVSLIQWIYVRKTDDGNGAASSDPEPDRLAVDLPDEIETHVCYGDKWKKVMLPNLEGQTQGRLFCKVGLLKRKALEAFGFTDDELILRAADIHYNEGGEMVIPALRLNVRVIHSKWYSLVVDPGMSDLALEGVQ